MDLTLPLDYQAIERILPHRYPFLLVDRITEFEVDKRIVGIKNVALSERYLSHTGNGRPALPPTILTRTALPAIKQRDSRTLSALSRLAGSTRLIETSQTPPAPARTIPRGEIWFDRAEFFTDSGAIFFSRSRTRPRCVR